VERWFLCPIPRADAAALLFCLPYVGAGATVYRRWGAAIGPDIEIHALQLPGRENRIREEPRIDVSQVAAAIAMSADRPYAIYGHSLGARLGFEVIRRLMATGSPLPTRFYIGAAGAPDHPSGGIFHGLSRVGNDELVRRLAEGGGVPAAVLAEPELLQLLMPALRADFTWLDAYTFIAGPPLPVPLVAFAGDNDPAVPPEAVSAWEKHTSATFRYHQIRGGHFFLHDGLDELAGLVAADLREALGRDRSWRMPRQDEEMDLGR
jgi:surfactin synthase thioesterase subunit